jgi:hypothetical protein
MQVRNETDSRCRFKPRTFCASVLWSGRVFNIHREAGLHTAVSNKTWENHNTSNPGVGRSRGSSFSIFLSRRAQSVFCRRLR